ncbi:MAG: HD domain-containing protein [Treponema sp.]|jgi:exopolyphosphatase/guanosine-5'-triphosphate,3'-diphosphate pyrophosphatase|nr:HD domain-containing protein [Treponema sp.]
MTKLEAVLEIGSTAARLLVAEMYDDGTWKVIDQASMPIMFGHDVFTGGSISRDSLLQCLQILNRFREQLGAWGIGPEHTTVIATNALREARNRDAVVDRILVKTGFPVRVIDGIEENRLMYLATSNCLKTGKIDFLAINSLILEVGGGSTEMLLIENGKIAAAHSLGLGTVRVNELIKSIAARPKDTRRFLEDFVRNTRGTLNTELNLNTIQQFIALGQDARFAAEHTGEAVTEHIWQIDRAKFEDFVDRIQTYSAEECVARFKIPYADAQFLHTSLLTHKMFLQLTKAAVVLVPATNIREGVIIGKIWEPQASGRDEFYPQIIASAKRLLQKYRGDEKHAAHVASTALKLFDALKTELGLDLHSRMLLETAALLHDIGMFIRAQEHQVHSSYIIRNSEIFGIPRDDMQIVAKIACFHRGNRPLQDDAEFIVLPRADRVRILKLTALLRIADALDRGHNQKINAFSLDFRRDMLLIVCKDNHDKALEKLAVAEKSDIFEAVFGYKVALE